MKGRTVLNEEERYNSVRHCRYTDEVLRDAPWVITEEFLEKNKIDFVAHDDIPYPSGDIEDVYAPIKAKGMFLPTQRTDGISTSDLVSRIVRDYDLYVRRNLARGYSADELNINFFKEKKLRLQNKMDELKDKIKGGLDTIGERTDDVLMKWEEKSRDLIENFLMLFKRRNLRHIWNNSKDKLMKALTPPGSRAVSPTPDESHLQEICVRPRKSRRLR